MQNAPLEKAGRFYSLNRIDMQEELVDLFDEEDRMTLSSVTMTDAYAQKERFLRGANLLVRNGDGKFWIPRRQSRKKTFPGSLDFSA